MNNRWSMDLVSSARLYSAVISLNTRVSEKKIARRTMYLLTSTCPSSTARDVITVFQFSLLLLIIEILFLATLTISRFTNKAPYQRPSYNLYKPLISFSAFFGSSSAQFNLQAIDLFLRFPIIQLL